MDYAKADCRGVHAPSRADFGAIAEISFGEKVRDREGAITSMRGACAPRKRERRREDLPLGADF
jgi:hypothetical protein